ncbi:hypothetical protein B0I32_14035 [Nonomuraea fuscirosea]|uniref:Uncharacterized protein n=1 Tax=Nonomuraea fuscirosea TaxID=1291556 RepID=A0A2T0LXN9_9ACTN|nr:hypothetical protein [Nonomuraea fuscirosea]PRX48790.1 hypothetical protein B0I32_14035 [Nonomuraea fuscirosea]
MLAAVAVHHRQERPQSRLRYFGMIRNNVWLHPRATTLNLRTLMNLDLTWTHDVRPPAGV